jgi:hypothetical protein
MSKITVSTCCHEPAIEDFKDNPRDHHDPIEIYTCPKCKQECEGEDVCEDCLGTGEVTTMETVWAGEPHQAPIGTQKCHCQIKEEEHDDQE